MGSGIAMAGMQDRDDVPDALAGGGRTTLEQSIHEFPVARHACAILDDDRILSRQISSDNTCILVHVNHK
ncbi:hypothetical protein GCM10023307_24670 [Lysobacter hankyongensis]|uniref:Uncharacterized protein n=1 Tax=Lysobacter hankyongensis TaxID=1176535 RepID=A0ABP9BMQ7_9GAMM